MNAKKIDLEKMEADLIRKWENHLEREFSQLYAKCVLSYRAPKDHVILNISQRDITTSMENGECINCSSPIDESEKEKSLFQMEHTNNDRTFYICPECRKGESL